MFLSNSPSKQFSLSSAISPDGDNGFHQRVPSCVLTKELQVIEEKNDAIEQAQSKVGPLAFLFNQRIFNVTQPFSIQAVHPFPRSPQTVTMAFTNAFRRVSLTKELQVIEEKIDAIEQAQSKIGPLEFLFDRHGVLQSWVRTARPMQSGV